MQEYSSSSAGQSQGGGQTPRGNLHAGVVCGCNIEVPIHPRGVLLVPLHCCDSDAMTSWDIADPGETAPPRASRLLETVNAWPGRVPDICKPTPPQAQAPSPHPVAPYSGLASPSHDHAAPLQTRDNQL